MSHQYYLKGFCTTMHMKLGRGGYVYVRTGYIMCPTIPEIHGKHITCNSGKENSKSEPYETWKIEGVETEFDSGREIIKTYDLVSVKAQDVNWESSNQS